MYSMTGFGKGEAKGENYLVSVELKSVNHRFKDFRFKMGSILNSEEIKFRKLLEKNFNRGSFDIYINYKKDSVTASFDHLDDEKIKAYLTHIKDLTQEQGIHLDVRPTEFLRSEFMLERDETMQEEIAELALNALKDAVDQLKNSREKEGKNMVAVLQNHRKEYEDLFQVVEGRADEFEKGVRERLEKKFAEYKSQIDTSDNRFGQEIIYYMEKIDIHEEINRIKSHLQKLDQVLETPGEKGRRIDFLVQELNRETNTIGSKSSVAEISDAVIKMKAQLEKIREQALNLE